MNPTTETLSTLFSQTLPVMSKWIADNEKNLRLKHGLYVKQFPYMSFEIWANREFKKLNK